ncbi:MAG: DegT/DnrJ/EryC1/StrS aminotransferase family protein [Clostridia bacterium]|nr:DegT/DnrJ/EryC1/StrS aminotransferase family protein [Clostridia bacterium]
MRKIPFSPPDITEREIELVAEALRSGWITTGPKTKEFETKIAEYCCNSSGKAVCLNSATACMEMALRLLGVGEGDEVITCVYTYTASASVACHVGAKVVLVDVAPDSFHIDYDKLRDAITEKTKAIIPVDIAGVMCDYDKILDIVKEKASLFKPNSEIQKAMGRVAVISDCAHGFGATYKDKKAGQGADFTSFSFHAVKNLTTAEGGALVWNTIEGISDDEIYRQLMLLSLHGQSKDALAKTKLGAWEYDIISPAYKCNMTDIAASIGLVQLERYQEMLDKRKKLIEIYDKELPESITALAHYTDEYHSSGHLYITNLVGKTMEERNEFIIKMAEAGIACNVHYKPLPMLTAYKNLGFDIKDYPNAYAKFVNQVSLPLNSKMSEDDAHYVCCKVKEILGE